MTGPQFGSDMLIAYHGFMVGFDSALLLASGWLNMDRFAWFRLDLFFLKQRLVFQPSCCRVGSPGNAKLDEMGHLGKGYLPEPRGCGFEVFLQQYA